MSKFRFTILVLMSMWLLAACGGGGGGGSSAPPATSNSGSGGSTGGGTTTPPTGGSEPPPEPSLGERTAVIQPVVNSALAAPLMDCLFRVETGACTFANVPLIGMETENPTIDDVMSRVIVSHEWMGTRFREILQRMPPEILLLMRGLTGVVISYDVRPSFYSSQTGAMYLDPDRMWLTEEERAVIDTDPDFRGEFASKLNFIILWRYVDNNTDVRAMERDIDSISLRTATLLYHELAHANDFFPPGQHASVNRNIAIRSAATAAPSNRLSNELPLTSSVMASLAQVSFSASDIQPTPVEAAYTSEDIAAEFPNDRANDYYNYFTRFEDLAMAFEEAMMYYSYGISRDVAVTNLPNSNFCEDYVVAWGQRNRISDPAILARSMLVIEQILPERAAVIEDALANLPAPSPMTPGVNWCDNINLTSSPTGLSLPGRPASTVEKIRSYE